MVLLTKLLLDDLENLLLVKLLRETLDGGQGLASISLCCTFVLATWSDFLFPSHRPMCAGLGRDDAALGWYVR